MSITWVEEKAVDVPMVAITEAELRSREEISASVRPAVIVPISLMLAADHVLTPP